MKQKFQLCECFPSAQHKYNTHRVNQAPENVGHCPAPPSSACPMKISAPGGQRRKRRLIFVQHLPPVLVPWKSLLQAEGEGRADWFASFFRQGKWGRGQSRMKMVNDRSRHNQSPSWLPAPTGSTFLPFEQSNSTQEPQLHISPLLD